MPFPPPLAGDNKRFYIVVPPQKQIIAERKAVTAYERDRRRGSTLRFEIFVVFQNAFSFHLGQKKAPCRAAKRFLFNPYRLVYP